MGMSISFNWQIKIVISIFIKKNQLTNEFWESFFFLRAEGSLKENDDSYKQFYDISIYFLRNQTLFIPYILNI